MNRIYKVIWSKVKHQYIVVSELAHCCTKRTSRAAGRSTAAVLAALVLTAGIGLMPVQAAENTDKTDKTDSSERIENSASAVEDELLQSLVGISARDVEGETKRSDLKPYEQKAGQVHRSEDIAIGKGSEVNRVLQYHEDTGVWVEDTSARGVAVGYEASVLGGGGVAVGQNSSTEGAHSLAVGSAAHVYGTNSISVGASAVVGSETNRIEGGISVGANANVSAIHSIAIGTYSVTNGVSAVSIGQKSNAAGSNAIAIGTLSKVEADSDEYPTEGIAIGSNAHTSGFQSAAIGPSSNAEGEFSEAFGSESYAVGDYSISVGAGTLAEGEASTVVGYYGQADQVQATALGSYSYAEGKYSTSLGSESHAEGESSISVGYFSEALGESAIAVGVDSYASKNNSIAIGNTSFSTGLQSTAIGYNNSASGENAIAIGSESKAEGNSSTAIGNSSIASGKSSIAIGDISYHDDGTSQITTASGESSMAFGSGSGTSGKESIAFGKDANVSSNWGVAVGRESEVSGQQSIAIGGYKTVVSKNYSTAIGSQSNVSGEQSIAMGGFKAVVSADKGTALGSYSNVSGTESIAGGYQAVASGDYGTALGSYSTVSTDSGTALGYNANVKSQYNVALGAHSRDTITKDGDVYIGGYKDKSEGDLVATASNWDENNEWLWGQQVKVGDFAGWQAAGGTVSVGYKGFERTITNVAAGRISADSTDAINGSQLYQVAGNLQNQIDEIKNDNGDDHYHTVNGNDKETSSTAGGNTGAAGNVDSSSGNETVGNATQGQAGPVAGNGDAAGGTNTDPVGDKPDLGGGYVPEGGDGNLLIKWDTDAQGNKYYDISLNKDLSIDNIHVNEEITVGDSVSITDEHINIGDVNISKDKITVGDNVTINDDSVNVGDITINENNIDMNNHKIVNVAEGTAGTDAVNVNQLNRLEQNITNQVTNLNGKVNRLDDKINKVGAGAAALAVLHPLDFDPDDKLSFSAGIGHYKDSTAAAIGAFYQPNDDTLFSIGGTIGNGEEMVNAGVSIRFGQHSHQSRSKKAMAKEIIELRAEMAELKAMVNGITGQGFDIYKSEIFPDTPETHWAYDYVAAVAGNGILEGYPSGRFDGSRLMTRYEMAAVIYRLMTQGVQVDQRMVDEFAPELARIKVDTLTHYNDGTPHIQRVRVIEGRG